jgi:hypothetical protein
VKSFCYFVLVCGLFVSCPVAPETGLETVVFDQARFDWERAAWEALDANNYRFDMHVALFFGEYQNPTIIRFVVENGAFKERVITQSGDYDDYYEEAFTLSGFYDKIEKTVRDLRKEYEGKSRKSDGYVTIDVVYDTEYHFPLSMAVCEALSVSGGAYTTPDGAWTSSFFSIEDFVIGD